MPAWDLWVLLTMAGPLFGFLLGVAAFVTLRFVRGRSEVADFFLGMTEVGKQCLVETHSEQMITRLRRRIVEARRDQVRPRLRIYFAERHGAETHFRAVQPDEYGTIVDWPEGFCRRDIGRRAVAREVAGSGI